MFNFVEETNEPKVDASELFLEDLISTIESSTKKVEPSGHYKPSSMNCMRSMYYQALKYMPDPGEDSHVRISMGQAGTDRHERIQKFVMMMQEAGKPCEWLSVEDYVAEHPELEIEVQRSGEFETKCFSRKYNLSFMCDGLIRYRDEIYILEIKTETIHKWVGRKGPAEDHLNQVSCYSLCFQIPKIMFLYENRDSCQKLCFVHYVTDESRNHVAELIRECNEYVQKVIAPPKCTSKRYCMWCGYKKRCSKE